MTILAIDWGSVGIKALQFILSFSILVTLHEMGHFFPAKWFKCRVEKFYLFFNPWFSLFKKQKGETEYGIGWIPFGGYVKISGMMDESMDKEQMKLPPQPHEFRSKKAWQRLIIMVGGVVVNVVLAIVIFIGIAWVWGEEFIPPQKAIYGVYADKLGKQIGLKDGDNIIAVAGKPLENIDAVEAEIVLKEAKEITIVRDGKEMNIAIPEGFVRQLNKNKLDSFVTVQFPFIIDSITDKVKINAGNLQKNDKVIAFNNKPMNYFMEYLEIKKDLKNVNVPITVLRNNKDTITAQININGEGRTFLGFTTPDKILGTTVKSYTFTEAVPAGFKKCFQTLDRYITGLKQLFTGKAKASESLGSVISIGNTFPGVWDWQKFWSLTGIFSIILAFMNILPIPALDGGHALFTIIEMITGRKPSDKFMEVSQTVGMVLLLGLMAYALGLDVWRIFK